MSADVNHGERAHARLSASGAHRWMNCTPSASMEEATGIEDTSSVFAEEGTLAHEMADLILKKHIGELTARKFNAAMRDEILSHELYSPDMDEYVEQYTQYVVDQFQSAKKQDKLATLSVEQKIDLTTYIPEGFGTNDAIVVCNDTLEVIDLKYGRGVRVDADHNPQLMLYALGALEQVSLWCDISEVKMTIVQPRLGHLSSFTMSAKELQQWGEQVVKDKAQKADKGEGELFAGSWCRFCKAAPTCRANAEYNSQMAKHDFKDPKMLTPEELVEAYDKISEVSAWLNTVSEYLLAKSLEGHKFPGMKVVEGRSNRKWTSEEEVKKALEDAGLDRSVFIKEKLEGITNVQKALGGKAKFEKAVGHLVHKPPGKPTLAPESDKRPAYSSAEQDFK